MLVIPPVMKAIWETEACKILFRTLPAAYSRKARRRGCGFTPFGAFSEVVEKIEQKNDRYRDTDQPEQNASHWKNSQLAVDLCRRVTFR